MCLIPRQNLKWNLWLFMLFLRVLDRLHCTQLHFTDVLLAYSSIYPVSWYNSKQQYKQGVLFKFLLEKKVTQNQRNKKLSRQNFNRNFFNWRYALTCKWNIKMSHKWPDVTFLMIKNILDLVKNFRTNHWTTSSWPVKITQKLTKSETRTPKFQRTISAVSMG